MRRLLKKSVLLVTFCAVAMACGGGGEDVLDHNGGDGGGTGNGDDKEEPEQPFVAHITPIDKLNQGIPVINSHADVTSRSSLKMNFRTYSELGESVLKSAKPNYVRVKRLTNGSYIMFYHNNQIGASCSYATSSNFKTWSYKGKVFTDYSITDSKGEKNDRRYSNCDGVVLSNGDILAVASYRANNGYRDLPKDAGIEVRRSRDNGGTWGEPISVYQGVNWEPYLLELSSGEIHCYFTDSSRTGIEGKDTGTAMVISRDGGQTWTPSLGSIPYYVIRMKWEQEGSTYFNHQMPSVIQLKGSNELIAAVETNNRGIYYISLVYSGEDGEWDHLNVDQEGPADSDNLSFLGSAPYLSQFPSGETVLSYNKSSTFYMKMGDAKARNFGSAYSPFSGKGYWGTLNQVNSHQLVGAMPDTSKGTIMLSQFILNHRIDAVNRSVTVDGDNKEWANTDHALFVGEKSQVQGTLRCSCDDKNVYFLVEVLNRSLQSSNYATVYISPAENQKMVDGVSRIQVSMDGLKSSETYAGKWNSVAMGVEVKTYVCNGRNENRIDNYGYIAEISIPRSSLMISSGQVLVNFSVTDNKEEEAVSDMFSINRWIPVVGL